MSLNKRYQTISVQENIKLRRDLDDRDASLLGQIQDAMATAPPTEAIDVSYVPNDMIFTTNVQESIDLISEYLLVTSFGAIDKEFAYDINGKLETITTLLGVKTFAYDGAGKLVTITGTGIYPSKTLSYDINGKLESITII